MVTLTNIKIENGYISADYQTCGIDEIGYLRIRIEDGEVVEHVDVGYGSGHAIRRLWEFAKSGNDTIPDELITMWY